MMRWNMVGICRVGGWEWVELGADIWRLRVCVEKSSA